MGPARGVTQLRPAPLCDVHGCARRAACFVLGARPTLSGNEDVLLVCACRQHEKAALAHAVDGGYLEGARYGIEALPNTLAFIEAEWANANVQRGIA